MFSRCTAAVNEAVCCALDQAEPLVEQHAQPVRREHPADQRQLRFLLCTMCR